MISTGNDAVHNVVGGGDVKNIKNSKYKTRHGAQELFTKNGSICQIPNTVTLAAANVSIFGIILVAAATTHRHENSTRPLPTGPWGVAVPSDVATSLLYLHFGGL